jgi:hypothetical protein
MTGHAARRAVAGAAIALTGACFWPRIGDIRPDAATHRVAVRADPANMELQRLVETEVARYRRENTRRVPLDSAAPARIMLVAGLVPNPAGGPPRLSGRLVDVSSGLVGRALTVDVLPGEEWQLHVPGLVRELLRRPGGRP